MLQSGTHGNQCMVLPHERSRNMLYYMTPRTIRELFRSQPTIEGAGVHLARVFAQPEVPKFDPFLLLDDFGSHNPDDYLKGFPWHPHRGIETITYMKSGKVEHQDSLGNKGVIRAGDVQWMMAGSGIIHQEMPQRSEDTLQGLQLWVNLPREKKMVAPRYRGLGKHDIPTTEHDNCIVKVIAETWNGVEGPASHLYLDVRYFDVTIREGGAFTYELPSEYTAFVYVYEGAVHIGADEVVEAQYAALMNNGNHIKLTTQGRTARCIVVAGEPIDEPVAWGGPIVMNTQEELEQAFQSIEHGDFIQ